MLKIRLLLIAVVAVAGIPVIAADLTPSELALRRQLGDTAPDPILLWPGKPPRFVDGAPAETVDEHAHIKNVSVPTISVYLPPANVRNGMAIIVCPGGGYGTLDWKTHVIYAAQVFNAKGVAVIGLKYRLRPPNGKTNEDIQQIALLDAQRALRLVRQRASEWGIEPIASASPAIPRAQTLP